MKKKGINVGNKVIDLSIGLNQVMDLDSMGEIAVNYRIRAFGGIFNPHFWGLNSSVNCSVKS